MIEFDRNNAFIKLKFDIEAANQASQAKVVHLGKCVAHGKCYAKNPAKDSGRF